MPGTTPPPRTRSSSSSPVAARAVSLVSTSVRGIGSEYWLWAKALPARFRSRLRAPLTSSMVPKAPQVPHLPRGLG